MLRGALPRSARLVALAVALGLVAAGCGLPRLEDEQAKAQPLPQTSIVYAADGTVLTTLHGEENRVAVPIDRIPMELQHAVVAIEDERFYDHRGVDLKAVMRALYVNAAEGRITEGGSTITQQYVKNTLIGTERTLDRKVREAALAYQLEEELTKEEILEGYLNTVYFGEGAYGVQAASKAYFSRGVGRLQLHQAALLAGLISAPSDFNPLKHPEESLDRRNLVLSKMRAQGHITATQERTAVGKGLGLQPAEDDGRYPAPYFIDYVRRQIVEDPRFGDTKAERENLLYTGGLRIHTTLNREYQAYAEDAVKQVLSFPDDPHGAMTVVDPRNGHIVAMVGGRDYFARKDRVAKVNLATGDGGTGRQSGSSFKTFALVAALQRGISPATVYPAPSRIRIPNCAGSEDWEPRNYDGAASGRITLEEGTIRSVNVVYAQVVQDLGGGSACSGARALVKTARQMGITSDMAPVPSAVLGTNPVNTLEMASAYGTLSTMGRRVEPTAITRITDAAGTVLFTARPDPRQVVNPAVAWVATQILQKVVQFGTGAAANIGRPAAGKTGTANEWRDAWFVGYVPQLVAAVWVGFPRKPTPMVYPTTRLYHVTGGSWPAQIWHAFMDRATDRLPAVGFPKPDLRYVSVAIDYTRGCLPNRFTPRNLIRVYQYPRGTEPHEKCKEPTKPQSSIVPSVVGLSRGEAEQVVRDSGFGVSVRTEASGSVSQGIVMGQSPAGGASALQGSTVTLTVSSGPPQPRPTTPPPPPPPDQATVPNVYGMHENSAINTLRNAGFNAAVIHQKVCDEQGCKNKVWKQDPSGGSKAPRGSTVRIWVNS